MFQRRRGKHHKQIYLCLLFLVGKHCEPQSINQHQTLSTRNTNRRCRVRVYAFVGQPLSKQLYTEICFKDKAVRQILYTMQQQTNKQTKVTIFGSLARACTHTTTITTTTTRTITTTCRDPL